MSLRSKIILNLYCTLGQLNWINQSIRLFYLHIFFPIFSTHFKKAHGEIREIDLRHSVKDEKNFNAFLSDLDITIVIQDGACSKSLIQHYLKIKKYLIFLDYPEVYSEKEFQIYQEVRNSTHWPFIYTLWSIRKINWNMDSLGKDFSKLNKIKKERSNIIALEKILKKPSQHKKNYHLKDFTAFESLHSNNSKKICLYSYFLETHLSQSIHIELSEDEFHNFLSLLPNQSVIDNNLKKLITLYEILITKASIRIDEALCKNYSKKEKWITTLENDVF